jgi:hypothetical protein
MERTGWSDYFRRVITARGIRQRARAPAASMGRPRWDDLCVSRVCDPRSPLALADTGNTRWVHGFSVPPGAGRTRRPHHLTPPSIVGANRWHFPRTHVPEESRPVAPRPPTMILRSLGIENCVALTHDPQSTASHTRGAFRAWSAPSFGCGRRRMHRPLPDPSVTSGAALVRISPPGLVARDRLVHSG